MSRLATLNTQYSSRIESVKYSGHVLLFTINKNAHVFFFGSVVLVLIFCVVFLGGLHPPWGLKQDPWSESGAVRTPFFSRQLRALWIMYFDKFGVATWIFRTSSLLVAVSRIVGAFNKIRCRLFVGFPQVSRPFKAVIKIVPWGSRAVGSPKKSADPWSNFDCFRFLSASFLLKFFFVFEEHDRGTSRGKHQWIPYTCSAYRSSLPQGWRCHRYLKESEKAENKSLYCLKQCWQIWSASLIGHAPWCKPFRSIETRTPSALRKFFWNGIVFLCAMR